MVRCIYCQEEKALDAFRSAEHVLPQCFGKFQNNLTLKGIVCDACNQYFGDNLECVLARDSFEGNSRFQYGVKKPEDFKSAGGDSHIALRIAEGEWVGAYVYREYSQQAGNMVLQFSPQVGFLMVVSGKYEYYLLDQIGLPPL